MEPSAEEFWKAYEAEVGEPVLARTMGQRITKSGDSGDWGLLILTPSSLRFRETPGENWFVSLFKTSSSLNREKAKPDLSIPISEIRGLGKPPRKLLDYIMGSPFANLIVEYMDQGETRHFQIAIDPKSDLPALLQSLMDQASGAQPGI